MSLPPVARLVRWLSLALAVAAPAVIAMSCSASSPGDGLGPQEAQPGTQGQGPGIGDDATASLCADGNCITPGSGDCDGGTTVTILSLNSGKHLLQQAAAADECNQTVDWGGSDADIPPDTWQPPLTEDYACPAGTIRVHVRDIWSTLADPTRGTIQTRPLAVTLISSDMWFPISARAESAGCDWYSVCAPQPTFAQFRLSVMGDDACASTDDSSGLFDLSAFADSSDVWIDYLGTSAQLQSDYSTARVAADGFRVTSDRNAVAALLCDSGTPDNSTPEGYTKVHIRYPWADPSKTEFAGTACDDDLANITTPPYPTTLRVTRNGCGNAMAMLELQNSHCPWYTLLIPNSDWTEGMTLTINYPNPGAPLLNSAPIELPYPRTADEYWVAYTGPPDDIAWSGQGVVCHNYSTRPDSYHFYTENPGPGYQGCGGDSDVTLDPCNPPTPSGYSTVHFRYIWAGQKTFTFFPARDLMPSWIILEVKNNGGGADLSGLNVTCTREADRPWFNCQVPNQYFTEGTTWRAVDKTSTDGTTEWNTVTERPFPTEPKEYWLRWYYGKPDYGGEFKFFDYYPDGVGGDWSATGAWNDQDCAPKPPTTPVQIGFGGWFPYDETGYAYPYGASLSITYSAPSTVQQLFNYLVQERYLIWKDNYIYYGDDACGEGTARVHRDDPTDTVSEGQGYGMAISAAIGDKDLFDQLWRFTRHYLSQSANKYCGGLMGWMWTEPSECRPLDKPCDVETENCTGNNDSAFDGDVDIGIGLIYAAMQWPEYRQAALSWILKMECELNTVFDGTWAYPAPGDTFEPKNCQYYEPGNPNSQPCSFMPGSDGRVNLSYDPPGYFRVFGDFLARFLDPSKYTEQARQGHQALWYKAAETVYEMYERCYDQPGVNPGLVTDWGTYSAPCSAQSDNYNWARALWRVAVDAAWFGNRTDIPENLPGSSPHYASKSRMEAKIDNIQEFFNNFYVNNPVEPNANRFSSICQNLQPDGLVTDCDPALGHNSYFVGSAATAYVSVFDDDGKTTGGIRREAIEEAISTAIENDKYYQESIGVYQLLFLTGNFPNPLTVP